MMRYSAVPFGGIAVLAAIVPVLMLYVSPGAAADEGLTRRITPVERQAEVAAGKYAIVVGVDDYLSSSITDLQLCVKDARAFADVLVEQCGYPASHVRLLIGNDANHENITSAVLELADRRLFSQHDTVLFYFSGHGVRINDTNMLVPVDGSADKTKAAGANLSIDWVQGQLATSGFRRQVLFIDACRNEFETKSLGAGKGFVDPTLAASYATGMKVFYGTKPGEFSREDESLGHGLFTFYLLEGLSGKAADPVSGLITFNSLEGFVFQSMGEYSLANPLRSQTPYSLGEGAGSMPLAMVLGRGEPAMQVLGLYVPQDEQVVTIANELLDKRGLLVGRTELSSENWKYYHEALLEQHKRSPSALAAYLLSLIERRQAANFDDSSCQSSLGYGKDAVLLVPDWSRGHFALGNTYT